MLTIRHDFNLHLHFAHLLEERLRVRLAPLGIHPRQARILDALGQAGQASQIKLAREFTLSASSMSTMASRLLIAGLIEKHADKHELRSNVLTLTGQGNGLLQQIHEEWMKIDQEIRDVIGDENAKILAALNLELRNAFGGSTFGEDGANEDESTTHP